MRCSCLLSRGEPCDRCIDCAWAALICHRPLQHTKIRHLSGNQPFSAACESSRAWGRFTAIAEPESMYPETTALKSTRPSDRGPQRQVFVAGVERAATLHKSQQDTVTLVS